MQYSRFFHKRKHSGDKWRAVDGAGRLAGGTAPWF